MSPSSIFLTSLKKLKNIYKTFQLHHFHVSPSHTNSQSILLHSLNINEKPSFQSLLQTFLSYTHSHLKLNFINFFFYTYIHLNFSFYNLRFGFKIVAPNIANKRNNYKKHWHHLWYRHVMVWWEIFKVIACREVINPILIIIQ